MSEISPQGSTFNNTHNDFGTFISYLTFFTVKSNGSPNFGKKRGRGSMGRKDTKRREVVVDRADNYFACECTLCKGQVKNAQNFVIKIAKDMSIFDGETNTFSQFV